MIEKPKVCYNLDVVDCREKAQKLIEELNPEALRVIVPILRHISELRETLDVTSDPEAVHNINEARAEFAKGEGISLNLNKI